jgi:hypothetical protein
MWMSLRVGAGDRNLTHDEGRALLGAAFGYHVWTATLPGVNAY